MGLPKLLCLDDDPDFNHALKSALEQHHLKILVTESQTSFFAEYYRKRPDICLIDINLGGKKEGLDVISKLRSIEKIHIPIIVLSRNDSQDEIDHTIKCGADDFVSKPLDEFILVNKVNMLLRNEHEISGHMTSLPLPMQDCILETTFKLVEINNKNIVLNSKNFILVGTEVELSGDFFKRYNLGTPKLTVSWVKHHKDTYSIGIDFNEENKYILSKIKAKMIQVEL